MLEFNAVQFAEQLRQTRADTTQVELYIAEMQSAVGKERGRALAERHLQDDGYYLRIVEQDSAVKGLMVAVRAGTMVGGEETPVNEIWEIALDSGLRGRGVASVLVNDFFNSHADKNRYTKVSVMMANVRARDYFERRWDFFNRNFSGQMTIGTSYVSMVNMARRPDDPLV